MLAGVPTLLLHPLSTPAERQALEARVHAASSRLRPDDALILATSGTSGRPHLVVHTRASLSSAVLASRSHLGAPHAADRWLLSLPFAHVGGLAVLLRAFSAGASVVLAPLPKTPAEVARLLVTSGTTLLSLVPTQLARLLAEPGFRFPEAVRMVLVGGAATPQSLRDLALARGVPLATTYGLTEMGSQVATHPVPALAGGRRGVGTALPGIDLRCGETRRLLVRGPMCMRCYLDEPTPQDGAGWLQTGDLAELLEDGCLEILGRADHLIVTGGENVSPQTVEAALVQTGLLTEACVVGLPDPVWGERVVAAVVCPGQENSASQGVLAQLEQDLRRRLEGAIARYALPKEFFWFPCLPRLPSGKIDRLAVLEAIRTPAASN